MRDGLGELLILSVSGLQVLLGAWLPQHTVMVVAGIGLITLFVPGAMLLWILRRELREAEEDLRAAGIDLSRPVGVNEGVQGKRPGQFGIYELFVLMTLAAIAFAIVRLPFPVVGKIFSLAALWIGFLIWQMCHVKFPATPTDRFNLAVTSLVGDALVIAMFVWITFGIGGRPLSYFDFLFFGAVAIGPALGIRRSIKAIRQAVSRDESRPAARSETSR